MIGQRDNCVILMSVVMHVGRARSFRGGSGGNIARPRTRARLCLKPGVDFADLGAFRSDEPKVLVGGRLNHASAEIRAVLAEAAARDG